MSSGSGGEARRGVFRSRSTTARTAALGAFELTVDDAGHPLFEPGADLVSLRLVDAAFFDCAGQVCFAIGDQSVDHGLGVDTLLCCDVSDR